MLEFLNTVTLYLERLVEANKRLLAALKEYQELLVTGELNAIETATPYVDRMTNEIRRIDEDRRAYVDHFFMEVGWNGPRNFTAITEYVSSKGVNDDQAMAFEQAKEARAKLIQALAEVDAQNSLNITLIGQGLSFADLSLRAILGCTDRPSTYGPSDCDEDDGPSLLDAQA
jgi:hypothetical protein